MTEQLMAMGLEWQKERLRALKDAETFFRDELGSQALVVTLKHYDATKGLTVWSCLVWGATEWDGSELRTTSGLTAAQAMHEGRVQAVRDSLQERAS